MKLDNDQWSRRKFIGLGAAVAASALLPGCSSSSGRIAPDSDAVAAAESSRRSAGARVQSIDFRAADGEVDLGGLVTRTWMYGGEVPGKEIRVRKGDVVKATFTNGLPEDTVIHWHGIALRNDMDGAAHITQDPIKPGDSFVYEYAVPDSGTYWFHPHLGTQLDRGLYSPLIVEDPADGADYDSELVVVFDDFGVDPVKTLDELKMMGMGHMGNMGPMAHSMEMPSSELLGGDAGDVMFYPQILANGRTALDPRSTSARPGERIRLRLINAAADTVFRIGVPGVSMRVTHTDGFAVDPIEGQAVLLTMGERVDAVITMPDSVIAIVGSAEGRGGQYAMTRIRPTGEATGSVDGALVQTIKTTPPLMIADFKAARSVRLSERQPDVTHDVVLSGPENKYDWLINGKMFDHADPFRDAMPIERGQRVRLRFRNDTEMFHPMHLHGHTFQVGPNGPRKDTVVVLPKKSLEVDFDAINPGQWLTHCHNLYHGESGMMAVVSYIK